VRSASSFSPFWERDGGLNLSWPSDDSTSSASDRASRRTARWTNCTVDNSDVTPASFWNYSCCFLDYAPTLALVFVYGSLVSAVYRILLSVLWNRIEDFCFPEEEEPVVGGDGVDLPADTDVGFAFYVNQISDIEG